MTLPAESQYKGTQTDEVIATPRPPRRFPSREETGETILAKPEEDTPLKTACAKLGAALALGGGQRFRMAPTGQLQVRSGVLGPGKWGAPQRGTLGANFVANSVQQMSPYELLRAKAKMSGTPLSGMRRLGAKALGFAAHPLGGAALAMGVPLAMHLLPGGRDEQGNRRSLAETGFGRAVGMAASVAPLAAPLAARRLTASTASRLTFGRPTAPPAPTPTPGVTPVA